MSYDPRGGGPEPTKYDKARHERMNLRTMPYGFFRVVKEAIVPIYCEICQTPIEGPEVRINGHSYHYQCYGQIR